MHLDEGISKLISRQLKNDLGFNFYGYDICIDDQTGDYYIVDINYFPGYKNTPTIGKNLLYLFILNI